MEFFRKNQDKIFEKLKEINLNMDGYASLLNAYYDLKKENPPLIPREVLQNHTRTIIAAQNLLLSTFNRIIERSIIQKIPEANIRTFGILNEFAPILQIPIPAGMQNTSISNLVLDFTKINIAKYIIILHGPNKEVLDFLKNSRTRLSAIICIKFDKNTVPSSDESKELHQKIEFFSKNLNELDEYVFPTRTPILDLDVIPNKIQLDFLIDEIAGWVKRKSKNLIDLNPKEIISIEKTDGKPEDGQMSTKISFTKDISPDKENRIILKFVTSGKQCSPYRLHVYLDNIEKHVTNWFGYTSGNPNDLMESNIIIIENISSGNHELKLQPEGRQEGCNQGYIAAWGGSLYIY